MSATVKHSIARKDWVFIHRDKDGLRDVTPRNTKATHPLSESMKFIHDQVSWILASKILYEKCSTKYKQMKIAPYKFFGKQDQNWILVMDPR